MESSKEYKKRLLNKYYENFRAKGYDEETSKKKALKKFRRVQFPQIILMIFILMYVFYPLFIDEEALDSSSFANSRNSIEVIENFYKDNNFNYIYESKSSDKDKKKKIYHIKSYLKKSSIPSEDIELEYFSNVTKIKNHLSAFDINIQILTEDNNTFRLNKQLTENLEQIKDIFSQDDYEFIIENLNNVTDNYNENDVINHKNSNKELDLELTLKENDIYLKITKKIED